MTLDSRVRKMLEYGHGLAQGIEPGEAVVNESTIANIVASWQEIMSLKVDGDLGPITNASLLVERCGCPDHQAAGQGTFNDPCFSEGIRFSFDDDRRPSSFSAADSEQMIDDVVAAYAAIGARMIRVEPGDHETIRSYWEPLRGSTIGLAQLTNGPCGQRLFCKIDPDYGRAGLVQMSALWCHEIGHNFGLRHTQSGIMSPTIVKLNSFDGWTKSDPSYRTLRRWYGGRPINPPPVEPIPADGITLDVGNILVTAKDSDGKKLGTWIPVVVDGKLIQLRPWENV